MSKHTPGPWRVDPDPREDMEWNNHIVTQSGGMTICFMTHGGDDDAVNNQCVANARLIAAAPDLLEALESCVRQIQIDTRMIYGNYDEIAMEPNALKTARAAIAKARGEE